MIRKILTALGAITFIMVLVSVVFGVTASYNTTVRIVDSVGNVINGTASAVTASYNSTVRVVDSTNHVIDSFGANFSSISGDLTCTGAGACTVTGANGNGVQFIVNNLGSTSTPACNWALGYICTFSTSGNSTLSVSNIPGSSTNPVIVELDEYASGLGNITLPATFFVQTAVNTSGFAGGLTVQASPIGAGGSGYNAFFWRCDGTNCFYQQGQTIYARLANVGFFTTSSLTVGGVASSNFPRSFMSFPVAEAAALPATSTYFDCKLQVAAGTAENATVSVSTYSCASGPTFLVVDCGSTAGSCSGPTTIATSSPSAVGFAKISSLSSTSIVAGDYICANVSAGTCVALSAEIDVEYHN